METQTLNPVEAGAATIIARKQVLLSKPAHIVLAFLGLDHPTPYVTWLEYVSPFTGRTVYESGHYFYEGDIQNAAADFNKRAH